jgi:two-component sensor histidine kinase/CheY-like chemotaxis protein
VVFASFDVRKMSIMEIKVLLIEDNPGDALLIKEMLSETKGVNINLVQCDKLIMGQELVGKDKIDLILLDLSLPDSQGIETFIQMYEYTREIPIIVMSGLDDEEIAVLAVQKGAQDYLVKGQVDGNILARSIRYAIERKRSEYRIMAALNEKEVLLKEIHHRVKNNLQIISSLLKLQSRNVTDKQTSDLFMESQNRIRSMALIHEKLYQSSDLTNIDFKGYVSDLVTNLFQSYGANTGKVALKKEIDDISLGIELAIPCGLIINELVSNAMKYAFPNGKKGEIKVSLHLFEENDIQLTVSDNGIGIPKDFRLENAESLGLHLVNILAEDQLKGEIELDRSKGTKFSI